MIVWCWGSGAGKTLANKTVSSRDAATEPPGMDSRRVLFANVFPAPHRLWAFLGCVDSNSGNLEYFFLGAYV